jgi:uroporphyrin-III C-methyltransferase/precorrin-2 dehydrogenase/sirohydrochlorin ferrochelatase
VSDTLVLATGTGCGQAPLPDCTRFAGPGTTTALYMSVRQAGRIARALMAQGLAGHMPVEVCVDVSKPSQRLLTVPVAELEARIEAEGIGGCAILLVTWPASARAKPAMRVVSSVA